MLCPKFTRLKGYFGKLIAHILRSIDEHLSKSSFSFSKRNSFYNLHRYLDKVYPENTDMYHRFMEYSDYRYIYVVNNEINPNRDFYLY